MPVWAFLKMVADDVRRWRLRSRLGLLAALVTASTLAASASMNVRYFNARVLEAREYADAHRVDEILTVLQSEMLSGNRSGLQQLVSEVGSSKGVEWVGVVDWRGQVRISSDASKLWELVDENSPGCGGCHASAGHLRLQREVVSLNDGTTERTLEPVANLTACHRCHDPSRAVNGVIVVDRSMVPFQRSARAVAARVTLAVSGGVLALLFALGLAIERYVLRRLKQIRVAARAVGNGDLAARAAVRGQDEIDELAIEFNGMAARLEAAMATLSHERTQLSGIVNGVNDGIALIGLDQTIVAVNRAMAGRVPAGTPLEREPYEALARAAGLDREVPMLPARQVLQTGVADCKIVRSNGSRGERLEEICAQPLHGFDGALTGVVEVWRDITERRELEAGLEQSERLASLGVMASAVAHEVGNPLAAIITAVEGLLSRIDGPAPAPREEVREYLGIIRNQVVRCRAVTERLLGFARVPGKDAAVVDVAAAAREVLALVAPRARQQKVELAGPGAVPVLAVAPERLVEQVLLNLVVNALLAMPQGGRLALSVEDDGAAVRAVVADSGPGLPEQVRRHLFEPFQAARPGGGGTGLGLFISRFLARQCGGTLSATSEPGRGATFTIELKSAQEICSACGGKPGSVSCKYSSSTTTTCCASSSRASSPTAATVS